MIKEYYQRVSFINFIIKDTCNIKTIEYKAITIERSELLIHFASRFKSIIDCQMFR